MACSPQIDDRDAAGFVPGPEIARPDLKLGGARMREASAPETGHSGFDPELSESCFGHVHSDFSRRVQIVAAPATEKVAT